MAILTRAGSIPFLLRALVLAVVVLFLAVQVPVLLGPVYRPVSLQIRDLRASLVGGTTVVAGAVSAVSMRDPVDVRVIVAGFTWASRPTTLNLFYDPNYPLVGSVAGINGLLDHFGSELRQRNLSADIRVLGADDLARFLQSTESGVLLVVTTSLPVTVFGAGVDLLTPWIRHGGTLIWIGKLIGGYSVAYGETSVQWDSPLNLQWEGETRIFGTPLVVQAFFPVATGTVPSSLTVTLGLQYNLIAEGAQTDVLEAYGGLSLGWVGSRGQDIPPGFPYMKTSIAAVHVGNGTVVLFGYTVTGPGLSPTGTQGVARDLAQILASGVLYTDYGLSAFRSWDFRVGAGETRTEPFQIVLNGTASGVNLFAFVDPCSSDPSQCFVALSSFARQTIPVR